MTRSVCYFAAELESVAQHRVVMLLEKVGYLVHKLRTIPELVDYVSRQHPIAVVVTDTSLVELITTINLSSPILAILPAGINIDQILKRYSGLTAVYFRSEEDPIDNVLETLRFLVNLQPTARTGY